MSVSDGLGPSIFCRKWEELDGKLFYARQSRHSDIEIKISEAVFPIFPLTWLANNYVSRQGKGINRRNEITRHNSIL